MLIGYARVSTRDQNLDRQIDALKAEGCERIFAEKASGKSTRGRPELDAAIEALQPDDTLIVAEWDRATRSMDDGLVILARINARKATVKALDRKWLDLTTPIGKGVLALLSSMAEEERGRILKRTKDGLASARARGVKFGRKPVLDHNQIAMARDMVAAGKTNADIARGLKVHRSTILRLRNRLNF